MIPLYEGVAPGSENWDWEENTAVSYRGLPIVQNVVRPVLMYYPPDPGTDVGTAMVIAPGGGFQNLMISYEGVDIAKYLNKIGVNAYVLKYRLFHQTDRTKQDGQDVRKLAVEDGQQAIRLVRSGAKEMGIIQDRIGMIGFSAGGGVTLASVMGTVDGRPDFAVPVYTGAGAKKGLPIVVPENAPPLCILQQRMTSEFRGKRPYIAHVIMAQNRAGRDIPNVTTLYPGNLPRIGGDNNHINAEGQIMLGKIVASAVKEFYKAKE